MSVTEDASVLLSRTVHISVEPRTVYDVAYSVSEDYVGHGAGAMDSLGTFDNPKDANLVASMLSKSDNPPYTIDDKTTVRLELFTPESDENGQTE